MQSRERVWNEIGRDDRVAEEGKFQNGRLGVDPGAQPGGCPTVKHPAVGGSRGQTKTLAQGHLACLQGPYSTHTPVILLLAENEAEHRGKALRSGADDYLIKPFHPAELMARMRSLLARYAPADSAPIPPHRATAAATSRRREPARVILFYGAKGGVGTTTIAINTAIALHKEMGKKVCLIDANLQFGDHRVFMDLGLDKMSVVDLATSPGFDLELIRQVLIKHESGVDLLLAPPSPETAELVTSDHLPEIINMMANEFDYVVLDVDKRLDEVNLRIMDAVQTIFVVMTADLPCLKNVRLVLETIGHLGYSDEKVKLILQPVERVHGHQREERRERPQAPHRLSDRQRVPRGHRRFEQRRSIHVHQVRLGARTEHARVREGDGQGSVRSSERQGRPLGLARAWRAHSAHGRGGGRAPLEAARVRRAICEGPDKPELSQSA